MPMYEYRCKSCGYHMDVLVKTTAYKGLSVSCEKCGSEDTEKVFANFSVGQGKASGDAVPSCCPTGTCGL